LTNYLYSFAVNLSQLPNCCQFKYFLYQKYNHFVRKMSKMNRIVSITCSKKQIQLVGFPDQLNF